ncbi:hypothetical protein JQX09_13185 [Sulfitobacter pseudonitzschiae]|uniref:DUF4376 domain-containing protein n=1 Tax=Pseudosulfitobacter pseudonitzschiae TaxID=1402135 RepID=A0A9Q2RVK4_9RHOB|nr:hypothetical protein [Pseudosulfitobacter pseudonitzschiae]MBM2293103.1 hypothetical protein [Pseudosulfitobacter pseudonitzschiae]MBM2297790.1 hypothetical protein [Pseudosulfitobacter pseudonitzschiae]MBM2302704.1 hypothetical protein [Pseudosulfitobacter pseudonitzschiae]MBM2312630.1 hypothetical protein [Pseudosulfitobacter pseudonitzschiae]MBM2317400.1 hypothetical protein [Pseudosulfitobacter pseudonitzschiae]
MRHAVISEGVPVEYHGLFVADESGIQHPLRTLNAAEKISFGVYEIGYDYSVPVGNVRSGRELVLENDAVVERAVYEPMNEAQLFAAIVAERERRLAAGFDYDFGDARGVHHIGTTADDMTGWDEVTMGANAAIALGAGSSTFSIVTETGYVEVTALEWQSILVAATVFRQPIWGASFALQAMDPKPADITDNVLWDPSE